MDNFVNFRRYLTLWPWPRPLTFTALQVSCV